MRHALILCFAFLAFMLRLPGQNPIITAGQETALEGATVNVPISVQNFTDVVSIQLTLEWDPAIVTYQGTGEYGLPGLSEFNFGEPEVADGRLTFVWFDGTVEGVTLPDDAVIFSVSFLAVGAQGALSAVDFVNVPTPIQIGVIDGVIIEEIDGVFEAGSVEIISEALVVTTMTTDNPCFDASLGSITPQVSGGGMPYTFVWAGPDGFTSTATELMNLAAGDYQVTITDQNGTVFTEVYTIAAPPLLEIVNLTVMMSDCITPTGSILLEVAGGTPDYSYDFGNGFGPDPGVDGLTAGSYPVQISDVENCTLDTTIVIEAADAPELMPSMEVTLCPGEEAILQAGSNEDLDYVWTLDGTSLSETTNEISVAISGLYAVTATNAAACTATAEITVNAAVLPLLDLGGDTSICEKTNLLLLANENLATYSWTLNGTPIGSDAPELIAADAGEYALTATTDDGCSLSDTIQIDLISFETSVGPDTTIVAGEPLTLTATGGGTYEWIAPVELSCMDCPNPEVILNATTTLVVNITTEDGCERSETLVVEVEEAPEILVDVVNFISPNGDGKNDVLIFRGLENYRGNRLTIYNRWGEIMYNKPDYQLDGVYWDGTLRGQLLPPGVYFYVLYIDIASEPIKSALTLVIE